MECFRGLVKRLTTSGYHFYRLGVQFMDSMHQSNSYSELLQSIKQTLDPNGVLAPGRYALEAAERTCQTLPLSTFSLEILSNLNPVAASQERSTSWVGDGSYYFVLP